MCLEQFGESPLIYASNKGNTAVVEQLLAAGEDVDKADNVSRVLLRPGLLQLHSFINRTAPWQSKVFFPTVCAFRLHGQC